MSHRPPPDWLRTHAARGVLAAMLATCLVLGSAVVASTDPPAGPYAALRDDEAAAQVVSAARRLVTAAQLRQPAGGYAFLPCQTGDGPPYQATAYFTFAVPQHDPAGYLDEVIQRLVSAGWTKGLEEPAALKLSHGGLIALIERDGGRTGFAAATVYGGCGVGTDHSRDDPVWTDIAF